MIWDFEFKKFKTLEIREEIREKYDQLNAKLDALNTKIESETAQKGKKDADVARLQDDKVRLERDIERLKSQMKDLDLEVFGSKPTQEHPHGLQGITHTLDSLRELQGMLKEYQKGL